MVQKKRSPVVVLLWCLVVLAAALWGTGSWFSAWARSSSSEKMDGTLRIAVQGPTGLRAVSRARGAREGVGSSSPVDVYVKVSDGGNELAAWASSRGARITSRSRSIMTVTLPWGSVPALAELRSVVRVESSPVHHPTMDAALGPIGINATALRSAAPRFTGKGVLVGVIDSGIDATNPAFRDADGKSRILYLWDATATGTGPSVTVDQTTFAPGYGVEHAKAEFDADPSAGVLDTIGHGTHVCGIAAGRDAVYPGVAPEARYLLVRWNFTKPLSNAIDYLVFRAAELKLPLVINYSAGSETGPHDGSSLEEQDLQLRIDDLRVIPCIAAGNSQANATHVQDQIPATGTGASVAAIGTRAGATVDIWYAAGPRPSLRLVQRSIAAPQVDIGSVTLAYGQQALEGADFLDGGGAPTGAKAYVSQAGPASNPNGANNVTIMYTLPAPPQTTVFVMELQNTVATSGRVDYYISSSQGMFAPKAAVPDITQGPTSSGTVESPSTTPGAISVAAYTTKNHWVAQDGTVHDVPAWVLGDLTYFSSLGPVRDTTPFTGLNVSKPDISAPGQNVASQRSSGAPYDAANILDDTHVMMQGTSMACPVVTGVVALMLQENPTLTAGDVKRLLFDHARKDAYTTDLLPNPRFGFGKVDADVCTHVVSPGPRLLEAGPSTSSTWHLGGYSFASSAQVLVNGLLVAAKDVTWNNHTSIDIAIDSGLARVNTVTVRNPFAPADVMDSTLVLGAPNSQASTGGGAGGGGGCFIATAAYGSHLDPHVMVLRTFRDRWLLTNRPGTALVGLYYRVSPSMAHVIAGSPALRFGTRVLLTPVVLGIEYPPLGVILVIAMFAVPASVRARRRARRAASLAA